MITLNMVKAGYDAGVIKLIKSPNGDGIVCAIGDGWFYFGGQTAENYYDVQEYKNDMAESDIIHDIFDVLQEFSTEFKDEYCYYEAFLRENGITENVCNHSNGLQPFRIAIVETYFKEVEIYASNSLVAEQKAYDLCSAGYIHLGYDDFVERQTECRGLSRENDLKLHEVYGNEVKAVNRSLEEQIGVANAQADENINVEGVLREER